MNKASPNLKFDFSERTVFVCAGSKGIGLAVAIRFAEAGAKVGICSRDPGNLEKARKVLLEKTDSKHILTLQGDVSEASFIAGLDEKVRNHFGSPADTIVNNCGGPPAKKINELTDSDWVSALNACLMSAIRTSQAFLPGMAERKFGRIIHLTSLVAKEPKPGMALSAVARAGVVAFSKTLAHEAGPFGCTSNVILTGGIRTDRFESLLSDRIAKSGETRAEAMEKIESTVPVRYVADPTEIADLCAYVASREAGYLNGTTLPFDGGSSWGVF